MPYSEFNNPNIVLYVLGTTIGEADGCHKSGQSRFHRSDSVTVIICLFHLVTISCSVLLKIGISDWTKLSMLLMQLFVNTFLKRKLLFFDWTHRSAVNSKPSVTCSPQPSPTAATKARGPKEFASLSSRRSYYTLLPS